MNMPYVEGRRGDWITIQSGTKFWPLDARVGDIDILDIAHALSNICRFGGHTRFFYSVSQHSVLTARRGRSLLERRWGLLHDAAEAYLGDVIRPIKRCVPEFKEAELRLMAVIAEKFGLPLPMPPEVKENEEVVLACEVRDLMPPNCGSKWCLPPVPADDDLVIDPWDPCRSRREFMGEFERLFS